jgi:2-iminobutanoate/2-iminopropanoate deaminase
MKTRKLLALLGILFLPGFALAQKAAQIVEFVNPATVNPPKGYSQAAVVDLGTCRMIIISGQVALDKNGSLVGKGDFTAQADQCFQNIKSTLESVGGAMNNVVRLGYYVTDMGQIQALRTMRDKYVNVSNPPTSTLVQISKLFRDDVLVEIEATAIIPKQ